MWEDQDDDGNSVASLDINGPHLQLAAQLLQVSPHELQEGLCTRIITSGIEKMRKPETQANALLCLHALCKTLYSKIFEGVVELVNSAMNPGNSPHNHGPLSPHLNHVAVLDIFGFESFNENR